MQRKEPNQIGVYIATSLVVGTMIGSGIFMLPASLAAIGGISIFGWVFSGLGALLIAFLFARLSKLVKKSGGPYIYPREGLGPFAGFLSGWGYWVSTVVSVAAVAIAFTGYFLVFFPNLADIPGMNLVIPITATWLLTYLNSKGVKSGGRMQLITTILKIIPLIALVIGGAFLFKLSNFEPFNLTGKSDLYAIGISVSLTMFAFLGIESATIPAGNIKNPEKNVGRATVYGAVIVIIIYVAVCGVAIGVLGPEKLANSDAPMADAAFAIWGKTGKLLISFGALVSTLGAMNGLILLQAQLPRVMADDKFFPPVFNELSKRQFPLKGLIISSLLVSFFILSSQTGTLSQLFTKFILLSTFLNLITYLFSSMSEVLILIKQKNPGWKQKLIPAFVVSIPTFAFAVWAVYGSGMETVFFGFIALILGTPFYVYSKIAQVKSN